MKRVVSTMLFSAVVLTSIIVPIGVSASQSIDEEDDNGQEGILSESNTGYEDGRDIGTKVGETMGKVDFVTPNARNDWEQSLKKFENEKGIIERYFLYRETSEYRESFITGFREAFSVSYKESYRKANTDLASNNINFVNVSMLEEELAFVPSDGVGKARGTLKIPAATVYKETHMGVSMERDSFNHKNNKYTPATHMYNVLVANKEKGVELNKPLELELEYFGPQRAGIYQLIGDKWKYKYTTLRDGSLQTEIPSGMFRGGQYAIFIDNDYVPILDIKRNWAQKELYTFLRRDYINGDKDQRYYPKSTMSRGEFLTLLGKTLNWNYEGLLRAPVFTDRNSFKDYSDAVDYAYEHGFVSGFGDGTFRAHDVITYEQIEWIMQKVLNKPDFNWEHYKNKMKSEKFTSSGSTKGKKRPMTKSEIVFMLYHIEESVK